MLNCFIFQGSISNRTELQVQLKFDAWWHYFGLLGASLQDQVELVVVPFLQFCFSSTVPSENPAQNGTPQSPAKKYSALRKKCLEATAILVCGLNNVKANTLAISQLTRLEEGAFKPADFITYHSTIFQCTNDIYETLELRSKLEIDQFSATLKSLAHLAELTSNQSESLKALKNYIQMLMKIAETNRILPLSFASFQYASKLPQDLLGVSMEDEKQPPVLSLIQLMFKKEIMEHVTESNLKDSYLSILSKFLKIACLGKSINGLNVIEDILTKIPIGQTLTCDIWKLLAQIYIFYVDKFNDINQFDGEWTKPKLTASYNLLTFPIDNLLDIQLKSLWKPWKEVFDKFNDKAPLIVAYKTLEAEDLIAAQVLKNTENLTKVEWTNLSTITQHLVQAVPYQSLSQESQGISDLNPLGRLYKIIDSLIKLLGYIPKFSSDKSTSVILVGQLVQILSQMSINRPLLKLICPIFTTILDKELMFSMGYEFETKVKNVHEILINRLQSRYDGAFDLPLLEDLKPFLKASLAHKNQDIKSKTHQMWQLTFGASLKDEIPSEFKDFFQVNLEESQSLSEKSSSFAVPTSGFSSIFSKMATQTKANNTKVVKVKEVTKPNIDEENSQDFVKISSPAGGKKRPLTEHQKEIMKQRKDDIPALYSELSRDDSESISIPTLFQSQSLTEEDLNSEKEKENKKSKRKAAKPKKVEEGAKKKRGRPPKSSVSSITELVKSPVKVHISRMSTTQLKMSQESPVKVVKENPLVIEAKEEEADLNNKKRKRMSLPAAPIQRNSRRVSQKLNMTVGETETAPKETVKKVKTNKYGESPLHVAIKKGDFSKAESLIKDGAEINLKDNAGWTPLHEAAANFNGKILDILKLLLENGASVNAKANNGSTPLHDAVMFLPDECVKFLLEKGADPDIVNDDGKTPRLLVAEEKRDGIFGESPLNKPKEVNNEVIEAENEVVEAENEIIEAEKDVIEAEKEVIEETPEEKMDENEKEEPMETEENEIPTIIEPEQNEVIETIETEKEIKEKVEDEITTVEDTQEDQLNDSSNSILATPLDESIDEVPAPKEQIQKIQKEESQDLIESSQPELIKPPTPKFKNNGNLMLSSRGARLLKMSKEKCSTPSIQNCSESPSQLLMSPRVESDSLLTTPTQPKPWQKHVPSPCDASPSASILKRSASDMEQQPPIKRRRVQFTDPPVSDQVVIPRCPSGKATRQKLSESRYNRDMFLPKDLSKEALYEATPPLVEDKVPSNAIYPSLIECDEPVTSILHNLTNKTWHKAAEKSLKDNGIETIGHLSSITALKASSLKSLRPPSNLHTIKEALRKFEKSWMKRGKEKKLEEKQSPTAAPVVHEQSTPEEEDEAMKEIYERPSPSPTESIEKVEETQILMEVEVKQVENAEKEPEINSVATKEAVPEKEPEIIAEKMPEIDETKEIVSTKEAETETENNVQDADCNTEVKTFDSSQTQTAETTKREKIQEFFQLMKSDDFNIQDLTEIITAAAEAIKAKNM